MMIQAQSKTLMERMGADPSAYDDDSFIDWKQIDETADGDDEETKVLKMEMRKRRKFIKDQVELSRQLDVQHLNRGDKIRCADSFLSFVLFGTGVASICLALVNWRVVGLFSPIAH